MFMLFFVSYLIFYCVLVIFFVSWSILSSLYPTKKKSKHVLLAELFICIYILCYICWYQKKFHYHRPIISKNVLLSFDLSDEINETEAYVSKKVLNFLCKEQRINEGCSFLYHLYRGIHIHLPFQDKITCLKGIIPCPIGNIQKSNWEAEQDHLGKQPQIFLFLPV